MQSMNRQNSVMVLATTFADRGDWTVEQQFVLQMGSSYLLAHGIGTPLAKDAVTTIEVPADGSYNLWVRTRNWTKHWSDGPTPGIFQVLVDGAADHTVFGTEKVDWHWQRGGRFTMKKGSHTLALHDLTGFDGRCDAIILTQTDCAPGDSLADYRAIRQRLLGPETPVDKGSFDFVIVGGGISGICAALAAARLGCSVALIQDRYVLGGNNSSEVRVGLGGQINVDPYPSLGYLLNEIGPDRIGNARGAHHYQDDKKLRVVLAEKNISLFLGYTVTGIEQEEGMIRSVIAVEATKQEWIKISGRLFSDCTGDAHLAVMAGAECRMGREARSEYGESLAPEKADGYTMGVSIEWYCEDRNTPCTFPDSLDWGLKLDEYTVEPVHRANWYWEVGMNDDQVADAEKIRDYGMYVAYVAGKRESRRIMGDLVLREQDLTRPIHYEDETCTTTWRIDQHYPMAKNSERYPGAEWLSEGVLTPIDFYALPYRCFYSKDVRNLFMAGRNISVTHIALGSTRVMRTCGMIGEVVGMAASICTKRNVLPRDIYTTYFADLQALMRKGTGRTDVPYTQFYHPVDRTGHQAEAR